jgi:hypothetical protein
MYTTKSSTNWSLLASLSDGSFRSKLHLMLLLAVRLI